jgi:phosphoketolase
MLPYRKYPGLSQLLHNRCCSVCIRCFNPRAREERDLLRQQLKDKLIEHKQYIDKHGEDLPEIHNWKWGNP